MDTKSSTVLLSLTILFIYILNCESKDWHWRKITECSNCSCLGTTSKEARVKAMAVMSKQMKAVMVSQLQANSLMLRFHGRMIKSDADSNMICCVSTWRMKDSKIKMKFSDGKVSVNANCSYKGHPNLDCKYNDKHIRDVPRIGSKAWLRESLVSRESRISLNWTDGKKFVLCTKCDIHHGVAGFTNWFLLSTSSKLDTTTKNNVLGVIASLGFNVTKAVTIKNQSCKFFGARKKAKF